MTGLGLHLARPASSFGAQQGEKLKAVDCLKRSQINRAAADHTPVNLPTWGHFGAISRSFQEVGVPDSPANAKAGSKDAH